MSVAWMRGPLELHLRPAEYRESWGAWHGHDHRRERDKSDTCSGVVGD